MPTNPYEAAVTFSGGEVGQMVEALSGGFKTLLPIGLGVIALVLGAFWLIRRAKKFANQA